MGVKIIFDVDAWRTRVFRGHPEHSLQKSVPPIKSPSETAWNHGKMRFKKGVEEGIGLIDSKSSGLNWLMMKDIYKNFVGKYGGDPNLDWTNFKIRRMYIKLRKKGVSEEQALRDIQEYV